MSKNRKLLALVALGILISGHSWAVGSVQGMTSNGVNAIDNLQVWILDATYNAVQMTPSGPSGAFTFSNLVAGTYYVYALDPNTFWVNRWWQQVPFAFVPFPSTASQPIQVTDGGTVTGINLVFSTYKFRDDMNDGNIPPWSYTGGSWSEASGLLTGTSTGRATTVAMNFAGCSICTFETVVKTTGGLDSKIWFLVWDQDKNNDIEILVKVDLGKVIMKERVNGSVVKKTKVAPGTIVPGTPYMIRAQNDGSKITLDFFQTSPYGLYTTTMTPTASHTGTMGFSVKGTSASFDGVAAY